MAQLYQNHIQVALHQVVKLSSPEENVSTIIVKDKLVHINNVHDTLCQNIWSHFRLNDEISYCASYKEMEGESCGLYSVPNYKYVLEKLKQHVSEIVSRKLWQYVIVF